MTVYIHAVAPVCALGITSAEVRAGLFAANPGGVSPVADLLPGQVLHLGRVTATLADQQGLPLQQHSRNNALLLTALAAIRPTVDSLLARYGPSRLAVVLGTSTSGIGEAEQAFAVRQHQGALPAGFHVAQQEIGAPAQALAQVLGIAGPAWVVSTACSSSAKAIISAARLLQTGGVDAVLCGGMDALCAFTVAGFAALESVSAERCNPSSRNRHGINIGEGGALLLLSREPAPLRLAGWGESSDAYHISAPAPDGRGAISAMTQALQRAAIPAEAIDYINLHGTATPHNDAMEHRAVAAVLGNQVAASSSKPLTGHTLGGAGALEAALCCLLLTDNPQGRLPPHWWDGAVDPELAPLALTAPDSALGRPLDYVMSNSFAFGGSNAALVLQRCG